MGSHPIECFMEAIFLKSCNQSTKCGGEMAAHRCSLYLSENHASNSKVRMFEQEFSDLWNVIQLNSKVFLSCSAKTSTKNALGAVFKCQ